MSIDFQNFTPYASLIGGVMIGLAASREAGSLDEHTLAKVEAFLHDPRGWSKAHGGA